MWSLGCVAAELYLGRPLFLPEMDDASLKELVGAMFELLGPADSTWLKSLPCFEAWYGKMAATAGGPHPCPNPVLWPPPCLQGCPEGLADLVHCFLQWRPRDRITIANAKAHSFLQPPRAVLKVRLDRVEGEHGIGSIAEGHLDPDLLRYLQTCPSWKQLGPAVPRVG